MGRFSAKRSGQFQTPTKPPRLTNTELKATLRRLSKMVLAGYGGASLLFFGVSTNSAQGASPAAFASDKATEEAQLADAINASEEEAAGESPMPKEMSGQYSWWDVLLGKHDQEIFERSANTDNEKAKAEIKAKMRATAVCDTPPILTPCADRMTCSLSFVGCWKRASNAKVLGPD